MAHTPGPWFVSGPFVGPRLSPTSGIQIKVARIGGPETDDEAISNARLIAAAPEMLAALRKIEITASGSSTETSFANLGRIAALVRTAIAKAEAN